MIRITSCLFALLFSALVWATDPASPAKDPLNYPLRQYALVLAVAVLGGFASWVGRVRSGAVPVFSVMAFVGELSASALAGLLCFWLCEWQSFSPLLTVALIGISGHMGPRALSLLEKAVVKKYFPSQMGGFDDKPRDPL